MPDGANDTGCAPASFRRHDVDQNARARRRAARWEIGHERPRMSPARGTLAECRRTITAI